jgi:type I restriction enzyme R subunit
MRPVQNIVEFKQIIGRGTRLFDKKYYFTIYDFVGACAMFKDPDWDGDTYCPVCGNWPCTCKKRKADEEEVEEGFHGVMDDLLPPEPDPCPVCGNLPCTCDRPRTNLIDIKLSDSRRLALETTWEQKIFFGDEFISLDEYVKRLFGRIPEFFSGADDLREKWANPETREQLLRTMDEAGFAEEKLLLLKNMLKMQRCDLLDVLEYIAYDSTPMERAKRVELVKKQYVDKLNEEQREFDNLILQYYVSNGFKELGADNLKTFITIKFNSMSDAKERLNMSVADIRAHYFQLQRRLYGA